MLKRNSNVIKLFEGAIRLPFADNTSQDCRNSLARECSLLNNGAIRMTTIVSK